MFKILIALALFLAIQGQFPGGYIDNPELIQKVETQDMVKLAVAELAKTDNLEVTHTNVVSVATQIVNGINFRIVFTAHQSSSIDVLRCEATIYQRFQGARSVSSVKCA
jgi:hypothetical protein